MASPYPDSISAHAVKIYTVFQAHPVRWFTNSELSREASADMNVSYSCVKGHTRHFLKEGLIERIIAYPENKFRLADGAAAKPFAKRLEQAKGF